MTGWTKQQRNGFTLLELLLAMAILGVVVFFVISLTSSVRHGGKVGETKQRMEVIAAKMQEYYRHQGNLPVPAGVSLSSGTTYTWDVPVDLLNLESKYSLDGFGQRIRYSIRTMPASTDTDIRAFEVDSIPNMAGYLLSFGGNQAQDATVTPIAGPPVVIRALTSGDDLLFPVNVTREATEIALNEVRELQRRVNQFDSLFTTGSGACAPAADITSNSCTPGGGAPLWQLDGVNCGTASLDQIESKDPNTAIDNYSCDNNAFGRGTDFSNEGLSANDHGALKFIVGYYAMGNNYMLDPWGRPYQWGCAYQYGNPAIDLCTTPAGPRFNSADRQYRKFFSLGPDGCSWAEHLPAGAVGGKGYCIDASGNYIDQSTNATPRGYESDDIIP